MIFSACSVLLNQLSQSQLLPRLLQPSPHLRNLLLLLQLWLLNDALGEGGTGEGRARAQTKRNQYGYAKRGQRAVVRHKMTRDEVFAMAMLDPHGVTQTDEQKQQALALWNQKHQANQQRALKLRQMREEETLPQQQPTLFAVPRFGMFNPSMPMMYNTFVPFPQ